MHEQIARVLYYCGVHLLYASIVWVAAWVMTALPLGSATVKYWIWLATSVNFIVPVGATLDRLFAPHLSWARPLGFIGGVGLQIAENTAAASALATIWLLGSGLMAARLYARLRNERNLRADRMSDQTQGIVAHGIPVTFDESCPTPSVDGLLHPHISLPSGIDRLLSEPELDAVLIHEATHAHRRDNLIRLVHEAGLCLLWFHPLVWITGSRLALFRELSCDESVIRSAHAGELVSALAKLATPREAFLLRSGASSYLSRRLVRLAESQPHRVGRSGSTLLAALFGAALAAGVFETVAHTACCFLLRK